MSFNRVLDAGKSKPSANFKTQALAQVVSSAKKVIKHIDGTRGVVRGECQPDELTDRASREVYILLDLGHVLRLYFGDDYFDVILDSKLPYTPTKTTANKIAALKRESEENALKAQ